MFAHHSIRNHPKLGPIYLTNMQHRVLEAMNSFRLEGNTFVDLAEVDIRIIGGLKRRGYIAKRSDARSDTSYRMTALGYEAYLLFKRGRIYHNDGLCPRCRKQPTVWYNGRSAGYCRKCLNAIKRKVRRTTTDSPCARCGGGPRHVSAGKVTPYCVACFKAINHEGYTARQARLRAQVDAGDVPTCAVPDCNELVRYTAKHVSAYCIEHERECNRRSWQNRRVRKAQAFMETLAGPRLQQAGD